MGQCSAHLNIRHRERNNAFTATAWTFHSSQQGVVPSPTTRAPGKWAACSGWRQTLVNEVGRGPRGDHETPLHTLRHPRRLCVPTGTCHPGPGVALHQIELLTRGTHPRPQLQHLRLSSEITAPRQQRRSFWVMVGRGPPHQSMPLPSHVRMLLFPPINIAGARGS